MSRRLRQSEVIKFIQAAEAAGKTVSRCEIDGDGKIVLTFASPASAGDQPSALEQWRAKHAHASARN
jgi:hypothetical protein